MHDSYKRTLETGLKMLGTTYRLDKNLAYSREDMPAIAYFDAQLTAVADAHKALGQIIAKVIEQEKELRELRYQVEKAAADLKASKKLKRRKRK